MINLDKLKDTIYRLALLKLDEEDAGDLTDEIMNAIEESLEDKI